MKFWWKQNETMALLSVFLKIGTAQKYIRGNTTLQTTHFNLIPYVSGKSQSCCFKRAARLLTAVICLCMSPLHHLQKWLKAPQNHPCPQRHCNQHSAFLANRVFIAELLHCLQCVFVRPALTISKKTWQASMVFSSSHTWSCYKT